MGLTVAGGEAPMAKISAAGDSVEYRWANAGGRALVLTGRGRLLGEDHRATATAC